MEAVPATTLADIKNVEEFDCIGIDEGQFFPDLVQFCEQMANMGKVLVIAALDGTFQRKPFGSVLDLVPLAEDVIKLSAVCMQCHRPASFSKRTVNDTAVEVIGGADKYISVCRACFHGPASTASSPTPVDMSLCSDSPATPDTTTSTSAAASPVMETPRSSSRALFSISRSTFAGVHA